MRLLVILIVLIFIGCKNHEATEVTIYQTDVNDTSTLATPSDSTELIPKKIFKYLEDSLPEWVIPDTSEYEPLWYDLIYERDQITYFAISDFNNDQLPDYVFTLKYQNAIRLVIIYSIGEKYNHWVAEDFNKPYAEDSLMHGILIEPPGRIDRVVDNKNVSLVLNVNGVGLMREEFLIKVYYWNQGKFNFFEAE